MKNNSGNRRDGLPTIPECSPEIIQLHTESPEDNFSYVIHDPVAGELALVDPGGEGQTILQCLQRFSQKSLRYILITHSHPDHIAALDSIRKKYSSAVLVALCRDLKPDMEPAHGELLTFGKSGIRVLRTPGHSSDSLCFYMKDPHCLFSGDTLFIEDIGFCNGPVMYKTLREIIQQLPEDLMVYPGHHYSVLPSDTLKNIRRKNPFLAAANRDLNSFLEQLKYLS